MSAAEQRGEGGAGWSTPVNVLVRQDEGREVVTGALTRHEESRPVNTLSYTPGAEHRLDARGGHRLTVAGHLDTSHGRVATTVARSVANTSVYRWTGGEDKDALDATWTDDETVTSGHEVTTTHRT